jgi:predicted amidohydrolase
MRKVYLTGADRRWAEPGDLGYPVWLTEIGKLAAHICLDACFPEAARSAALRGAQVIGLPTNWDNERAPALDWFTRAYENGVYFIAADRYGAERGTQFSGGSCVIGPAGDLLARLDTGDGIVEAEVDLACTNSPGSGGAGFGERRPEMYAGLPVEPHAWPRPAGRLTDASLTATAVARGSASAPHVDKRPESPQHAIFAVQPVSVSGDTGTARAYAQALIERANGEAGSGHCLIVLPELAFVADPGRAADQSEALAGPSVEWAASLCHRRDLHMVLGLPERAPDGLVFNSAVLVGPGGLIGVYRKLHLSERDRAWAAPGEAAPQTWDVPGLGRVGLMIGHDALFPEVARCLAVQGAEVICAPSAVEAPLPVSVPHTKVPLGAEVLATPVEGHWHLWRGRAGENGCRVAFANRADPPHMGWSGVFGPDIFRYPRSERVLCGTQEGDLRLEIGDRRLVISGQ